MALIDDLDITDNQLKDSQEVVQTMVNISQKGEGSPEDMEHLKKKWLETATRLNKGGVMLEEMRQLQTTNDPGELKRQKRLSDLYTLLVSNMGIFETFFKRMLPKDEFDRLFHKVSEELTKT